MSGICGILSFDGGDPDVAPMLALLERRGPDGTHCWADGPVALGHTLLATTPEALVEVLPLTEPDSGCTITADARLDNRDELIAALDLNGEKRTIGDGELILRAYLRWGDECPKHLLGDFAFAIWDGREQRLFCARDHMGMRQLIYHHAPGRLFAFATEAEALVAHGGVPKRINEARIADFLDDLEGIDLTSTFFEEVFRLPPAHSLIVDGRELSLRRYWELRPGPELRLDSDEAYEAAFLDVFTQAVRCRLRSAGPVGSMLSGGIDSNSVAAVASRMLATEGRGPPLTFSAVGPDRETCVETRAIQSALRGCGLSPTLISHTGLDDYKDELIRLTAGCAEPFDGHMTLVRTVYLAAHRRGVKVMLDGVGGDVVLTSGNRVAQLLLKARIGKALSEAREEKLFWGPEWKAPRALIAAAWAAFAPERLRTTRRNLEWHYQDWRIRAGRGRVSADFARKFALSDRRNRFRQHIGNGMPIGAEHRTQSIRHPHLIVGRERYDRVASALAIEPRDPFLDIRLIAFCLSLPASQLQDGGWPKIILRRAMAGMVPSDVIWRRGKEHLGWTFTQAMLRHWKNSSPDKGKLAKYVSNSALSEPRSRKPGEMDRERQFELLVLSCWLARNQEMGESFKRDGE